LNNLDEEVDNLLNEIDHHLNQKQNEKKCEENHISL